MNILPVNEPKKPDLTPKNYLIWGESMSGKTYLARQFPNPLIINTDGNAKKVDTPSVEISKFTEFIEVIDALEKEQHDYKTVIIDLVADIEIMLTNYICEQSKVEALADIGFGKGFAKFNQVWKNLMMKLSQMPYNIIFISHLMNSTDENDNPIQVPSLPQKQLNACQGRCDLVIQTRKLGTKYISTVTAKRDQYTEENIKDKQILNILKPVMGLFPRGPVKGVPIIDGDIKLDKDINKDINKETNKVANNRTESNMSNKTTATATATATTTTNTNTNKITGGNK